MANQGADQAAGTVSERNTADVTEPPPEVGEPIGISFQHGTLDPRARAWLGANRFAIPRERAWHRAGIDRIASVVLTVHQEGLEIRTRGAGFTDLTAELHGVVGRSEVGQGLCTIFVQHTSASLVISENADPAVLRDLERWMSELAPEARRWEHSTEGRDDMPAHARSALTRTSESIPVEAGRLALGTWQAVYLWEHRASPHSRRVVVHVAGAPFERGHFREKGI